MDDARIDELYSIPDDERTAGSLGNVRIDVRGDHAKIFPPDRQATDEIHNTSVPTHAWTSGSTRVKISSEHTEWIASVLFDRGYGVKIEGREYDWDYLDGYPENWDILRRGCYQRDDYTCQECGATDTELHAHHIEHRADGGDDELDNLRTLCTSCHSNEHDRTL